jgi:hypothetical protein
MQLERVRAPGPGRFLVLPKKAFKVAAQRSFIQQGLLKAKAKVHSQLGNLVEQSSAPNSQDFRVFAVIAEWLY